MFYIFKGTIMQLRDIISMILYFIYDECSLSKRFYSFRQTDYIGFVHLKPLSFN